MAKGRENGKCGISRKGEGVGVSAAHVKLSSKTPSKRRKRHCPAGKDSRGRKEKQTWNTGIRTRKKMANFPLKKPKACKPNQGEKRAMKKQIATCYVKQKGGKELRALFLEKNMKQRKRHNETSSEPFAARVVLVATQGGKKQ